MVRFPVVLPWVRRLPVFLVLCLVLMATTSAQADVTFDQSASGGNAGATTVVISNFSTSQGNTLLLLGYVSRNTTPLSGTPIVG